jgi:hypothetical protein
LAVIVFHAGMSKTGSTSIQHWLAEHLPLLRSHGIESMRIDQPTPTDPITVVPSTQRNAASKFVPDARDWATRSDAVQRICEALDAQAKQYDVLVVSSESYEVIFTQPGPAVLAHLEELARAHSLRIAYYVRPQHSWLLAAWLQWGFRHFEEPDAWIRRQQPKIQYLRTLRAVRAAAPHVSFEMRPFRADLLDGGDVVSDFARVVLGLDGLPPAVTERWSNRTLPLDAAILLREAPPRMFWSSIHDNKTFYPLKALILGWNVPESEAGARSREVLQRYAQATFESDNQQLIKELGWQTESFIPPTESAEDASNDGLAELNDLWRSRASPAERQLFFNALQDALSKASSSPKGGTRRGAPDDRPKRRS